MSLLSGVLETAPFGDENQFHKLLGIVLLSNSQKSSFLDIWTAFVGGGPLSLSD